MAQVFDYIPTKISNLIADVESGRIGLPDLQRPFVWSDVKVRNLFDSMYRGFPIGFIMLWYSPSNYKNTKTIGINQKTYPRPDELVIDGQQRITALLAAISGTKVKDKNFKERRIRISFDPLNQQFYVWSKAYDKSHQVISDISEVFKAHHNLNLISFRGNLISRINDGRKKNEKPELTEKEKNQIEVNLNNLIYLLEYSIPTLRIMQNVDEEDVAEIFKRVNSGGQNLNENNFIETLLAVYDNTIFNDIKAFCEASRTPAQKTSYNNVIEIDPSHIIRIVLAYGFNRARMKYGYKMLRGEDLATGEFSESIRNTNLKKFRDTLNIVLGQNDWHAFLNMFPKAGYLNKEQVRSDNVVVYSYVFYLLGKYKYKVAPLLLEKAIVRWIFMATIKSYYTSSPESKVEKHLNDLKTINNGNAYLTYLNSVVDSEMNASYFSVELINALTTSSASSPLWFGYIASLNILGTNMLFSNTALSHFLILGSSGTKKSIDKHHIFPKNYLNQIGIKQDRVRNQIANFTYIDYGNNIDIDDLPPAKYVVSYKATLGLATYNKHLTDNAIPLNFETMDYMDFLKERRKLMAGIIEKAYKKL